MISIVKWIEYSLPMFSTEGMYILEHAIIAIKHDNTLTFMFDPSLITYIHVDAGWYYYGGVTWSYKELNSLVF